MSGVQHIEVHSAEAGQKLLQFLMRRLGKDVPKSFIMRIIRKGQVRVDGGRRKPYDRLEQGQIVRVPPIRRESAAPAAPAASFTPLPVLYNSGGVLAIEKPAGLPVQPGTGHVDAVSVRLRQQFPDAEFVPTPAHRLDRDTSGVLFCGTSYSALRDLQQGFQDHSIQKFYLAQVHGEIPVGTQWEMRDELQKASAPGGKEKMRVGAGKLALAQLCSLSVNSGVTLVQVQLFTGRTHQIRVQLAARKHPILGDLKYGSSLSVSLRLHCHRMIFGNIDISSDPLWLER
ncbi:pseudouridine synthase [Desulfobaculum bizertense]|uniref:Ribosomal large subunit pseudouridine synthase C n=1 Tax=Desulfobaculum bizertense DSM 18034 TaxID=1121442 RepID=A0A1T4X1Z8_9BACT|nr:RluA family pseudouridine synthase [Desulfobaculum bizertense]SKA83602.1 23S rRNA pseudouridine955/2504/2580 synthase [Desulfobaculum bizertense DSM 18034]